MDMFGCNGEYGISTTASVFESTETRTNPAASSARSKPDREKLKISNSVKNTSFEYFIFQANIISKWFDNCDDISELWGTGKLGEQGTGNFAIEQLLFNLAARSDPIAVHHRQIEA